MVNYPKDRGNRNLGSGGGSSVGAISYDANAIKNAFLSRTSGRKLDRRYKDGDGGYFTGGRCGWGVGHVFEEDVQKLMNTFNKVSEMSGAIQNLKNVNSSSEFSAHKNALIAKANQAIAEMDLSNIQSEVGYSTGLCIIWTDHIADFLGARIIAFKDDLMAQVNEINGLNYEALVKLEELKLEQQEIEREIKDTYQKYETETDPSKKAELYKHIMSLREKYDEVGKKIMANPWNKASQYDYSRGINEIISALEGKTNPKTSPPPDNKSPNGQGQAGNQGGGGNTNLPFNIPSNNPWQPNQPNQNSGQLDQQTLMIIVGAVLVIVFLLMNQKDSPSHRRDYDEFDYY